MNATLQQIITYLLPIIFWFAYLSVTLRLLTKKQAISVTVAWLLIIYLFPIVGVVIYLILGEVKLGSKRAKAFHTLSPQYLHWFSGYKNCDLLIEKGENLQFKPLFDLCQKRSCVPCLVGNELHILTTPAQCVQSIVQDIEQAKSTINMVFYIWQAGGLVDLVSEALVRAVKRGVKVHILLDSVGSRHFFNSEAYQYLTTQGIVIKEALHVSLLRMFLQRIDLRQHRKVIVIDNSIAYTGSMNMVDPKYFKQSSKVGEWIDIMVRIDGPASSVLNDLHAFDWQIETNQQLPLLYPQCLLSPAEKASSYAVQILATGPGFPDELMPQTLLTAIFSARQSITITSPYFVPNQAISEALKIAALRGVKIDLIIPQKNDSIMVKWASRTFFDELLSVGVNIYHFSGGLLHTKSILIDQRLALVGTVNMDIRSFMLNLEVTMIVEDPAFAKEIHILHQDYLNYSVPLALSQWRTRPFYQRVVERIFFFFSPLL